MAAISLSAIAADFATNATDLAASDSDLTAAQFTALSQLIGLMAARRGDSVPLMQLLTDTNKAELKEG